MKFNSKRQAEMWRKCNLMPQQHRTVETVYLGLKTWQMIPCYTVVYVGDKRKRRK